MEHLDLAGYITTPTNWNLASFEQQDAIYLSNSRQMLEPIMEETSEDEEHAQNSWNQYETGASFWSSAESETGSVIRVEINKDLDAISERDFACPPKRARRSDEFLIGGITTTSTITHQQQQLPIASSNSLEDTVQLRRPMRCGYELESNNSLERFLAYEASARDSIGNQSSHRGSTGSRRFDEFYSDSESYHSLSRSSSLIQFESLERQLLLQEQHTSMNSLGNSSPSLLSFDASTNSEENVTRSGGNSGSNSGSNSRRGSQNSLMKRFESSDGRLHQTYFELNKLNFDDDEECTGLLFSVANSNNSNSGKSLPTETSCIGEIKSDSESSTSSGSSSGNSILTASKPSAEDLTDSAEMVRQRSIRIASFQTRGGKNSAENLSEDSGYGEPSTLRRAKSKSIPKNFEKFCEEDEEFVVDLSKNNCVHSKNNFDNNNSSNSLMNALMLVDNDLCQPKINDATFIVESNSEPETPLATSVAAAYFERVINSPKREIYGDDPQQQQHRRSMAHSPSPVSSELSTASSNSTHSSRSTRSSTSSNDTCASAASFTWLPKQQEQKEKHPKNIYIEESCDNALADFSTTLRNSLPDIREAYGTENSYFEPISSSLLFNRRVSEQNGYGLEKTKVAATYDRDESDISTSTSSSSSTNDSRTQSDAETSPETRKRVVVGGGASGASRGRRISSVPNELNKLGRKKRATKYRNSKSSTEEDLDELNSSSYSSNDERDDFFDINSLKIQRSCSWSERRERNLQKFEGAFGGGSQREKIKNTQSLGYMNASYHNLTLLDYSEGKDKYIRQQPVNHKHSVDLSGKMDSRKCSGDYESIICKDNFLLDELSVIYDKNASILNDKTVLEDCSADTMNLEPPACSQKQSSSNSDLSSGEQAEVQHVQLTIRKPPARQKRRSDVTNSLVHEPSTGQHIFTTFGKTFDQDPTNLRTSYAQSLEKCNFDPKELSNTDLSASRCAAIPKRRFQTQAAVAKKRNLVSSTPNLNAYDPHSNEGDDDDMYVSSAHTSMHQLPQNRIQKPLGILLPAGSRTSFGKEVSFCPVVSKYSWQEQSSEECNEPQLQQENAENAEHDIDAEEQRTHAAEEDSDDELLDNADATVIYNTKENEMIAARYKEEQKANTHSEQREIIAIRELPKLACVRATLIAKESIQQTQNIAPEEVRTSHDDDFDQRTNNGNKERKPVSNDYDAADDVLLLATQISNASAVSRKPTSVDKVTLTRIVPITNTTTTTTCVVSNSNNNKPNNISPAFDPPQPDSTPPRPLSLHLPILSEPPTNRAHHILYASQQLLDRYQRREAEENISSESQQHPSAYNNNKNNMSNYAVKCSENESFGGVVGQTANNNNSNERMKSKFKADEKHPSSKGFLSRFANGFRFSLRRNKKKQLEQQQLKQAKEKEQQQQLNASTGQEINVQVRDKHAKSNGSTTTSGSRAVQTAANTSSTSRSSSNKSKSANISQTSTTSTVSAQSAAVAAKIGAKLSSSSTSTPAEQITSTKVVTGKPPLPKLPPRTTSVNYKQQQHQSYPYNAGAAHAQTLPSAVATNALLDSERSYYYNEQQYDDFKNQLNTGMHANGYVVDGQPALPPGYSSPSRASVSQKTQMFNQLNGNASNGAVGHRNHSKIGLIETNLDTHETIISGKTRSLMDIASPQHKRYVIAKRFNATSGAGGGDDYDVDNDESMNVVAMEHDDDVDGAGGIVIKAAPQSIGGQIASVRRPHKSMEFLLDKENQKNVLPPENELQKSHEHNPAALSEHQLRVQASLQRLNIPDWFRQYNQNAASSPEGGCASGYKPGNFTRKRTQESGRWAGLNSKTTSLSSLGSQRSDRSPLLLSPSAHSHHGGQSGATTHQTTQYSVGSGVGTGTAGGAGGAFSRWSTSHLNSSQTSPSVSQRSSFARGAPINSSFISVASGTNSNSSVIRSSFRQPYLGWRSQEKLSQRTPHERLASTLLAQQQRTSPNAPQQRTTSNGGVPNKMQPVTPEIQSSIKEVTSAIVHYVNDQTAQQRSRSASPNSSRKCWLESSFVGIRPLESPQTPVIETNSAPFGSAVAAAAALTTNTNNNNYNFNYNNYSNNTNYPSAAAANTSTTTFVLHASDVGQPQQQQQQIRMNGLSRLGGGGGESTIYI